MGQTTQKSALLVMDMMGSLLNRHPNGAALVTPVVKAVAAARASKIAVIHVKVTFREGAPEISPANKGFSAFSRDMWTPEFVAEWERFHPELQPEAGEVIISKRRFSAFTGSDLEVVLRANGINHLVLTGWATSGVVLSTLREAADKDYHVSVIADACADPDDEVHQLLTEKVFPRQATMLTVDEWCAL